MSEQKEKSENSRDELPPEKSEIVTRAPKVQEDFEVPKPEVVNLTSPVPRPLEPDSLVRASTNKAKEAASIGGTAMAFPDPEPWPKTVDGAGLLDDLTATFRKYLALADGHAETLALWTLHAHALEASVISPLLFLSSAEKQSGKTRTLELLNGLVPRPLFTSNITAAALFRTVERYRPTLLIDEADSFARMDEGLRGILNSGHSKSGAYVIRTVGDNFEPQCFSTWCAKAVAAIGSLPGTVEDRAIILRLKRRAPGERIEQVRRDLLPTLLEPLRRQAAKWTTDNLKVLADADPKLPDEMSDRARDNWRPLMAIAEVAGGTWPQRAREAVIALCGATHETETSLKIQVLADLRQLFDDTGKDTLGSAVIVDSLVKMEDRPWPEFSNGKQITVRQLAKLLGPFGVRPGTHREGTTTFKGYTLADLEDAFSRYLPSSRATSSVTTSQSNTGAGNPTLSIRNTGVAVTDAMQHEEPRPACIVTDVTDRKGKTAREQCVKYLPEDTTVCRLCYGKRFWCVEGQYPECVRCNPPAQEQSVREDGQAGVSNDESASGLS